MFIETVMTGSGVMPEPLSFSSIPTAVPELLYTGTTTAEWHFPSGVPDERFVLVGVEVNATFHHIQ
jgi:hypothetical protein